MLRQILPVTLLATCAVPAAAQSGGIEIFAGEPLFESGYRVSLSYLSRSSSDVFMGDDEIADSLGRRMDDRRLVLGVDHGLSKNTTISVLIPYVDSERDESGGSRDASGLGDVALLGKYRFFHDAWPQGSFNAAVIGGLELPTGSDDEVDGAGLLPPGLQPGYGAWNPFLATSATYEQGRARFDGTLFHKLNTEGGQDLERGDFSSIDLSGAYRFYHAKYPGPTLGGRLGLQYRHEGRAEVNGAGITNSGSDVILGKASLSWHPRPDVDASIGVEEPLWEDYQGEQLGRGTRFVVKLGLRF